MKTIFFCQRSDPLLDTVHIHVCVECSQSTEDPALCCANARAEVLGIVCTRERQRRAPFPSTCDISEDLPDKQMKLCSRVNALEAVSLTLWKRHPERKATALVMARIESARRVPIFGYQESCHTSCHVTHHAHGAGRHRSEVPRQTDGVTKLPMVGVVQRGEKKASSVTWYSGTPAPGDPMPPHWVRRHPTLVTGLDSHQCQKVYRLPEPPWSRSTPCSPK